MPRLQYHCPVCNKATELISEYTIGNLISKRLACGHIQAKSKLRAGHFEDFVSIDGCKPRKFQLTGATFAVNSNGRFAILDEMGLGKTVQACMFIKETKKRYIWLCKSKLKIQTMREIQRWCGPEYISQIIESENDFIMPCKGYILSFDMLWRFKDIDSFILQKLKLKPSDVLIVDEVQHIKNSSSKRTNGVRQVSRLLECMGGLSGTPIKNNAAEYFPFLNMLRPDKFPARDRYEMSWVESYWDGRKMKYGGLKNPEAFKEYTKDFMIRRTMEEVLPDMPKMTREYRFSDMEGQVEEAYKEVYKEFQEYFLYKKDGDSAFVQSSNILGYLSKMRHITGIAKVNDVVEFVVDFLESTDRKIIVFVHHKDVAKVLVARLAQENIDALNLPSGLSDTEYQDILDCFKQLAAKRVLVASTLASGEGFNLQFCSDCVFVERQWNPANEEQAEGRIKRMGQTATRLTSTYFTAVGTVDEFFAELVEKKRSFMANTLDGKEIKWDENNLIKELTEILAMKGGAKWQL